jgi:D-tyrosyl-tRNA(Tyr) deacylase
MRCLIQRVSRASVTVDNEITGEIGRGLLVLVCAMQGDSDADAERLAQRTAKLRIFPDEDDRMNRSLLDIGGEALIVSQFTLAAETKGNRPGFTRAAAPDEGRRLYELFGRGLAALGVRTAWGRFAADMQVALVNDGPVTIWLDTRAP